MKKIFSHKGLDYLCTKGDGKIEISRMGGDFGVALGYGRNADGTFPSAAGEIVKCCGLKFESA